MICSTLGTRLQAQRQRLEDFGFHLFGLGSAIGSEIYQSPDDGSLKLDRTLLPVEGGLRLKRYPNFIEGGGEHQEPGSPSPWVIKAIGRKRVASFYGQFAPS